MESEACNPRVCGKAVEEERVFPPQSPITAITTPSPPLGESHLPISLRNSQRKVIRTQRWFLFGILLILTCETISRQRYLLDVFPRTDSTSYLTTPLDPVEAAVTSAGHPTQAIQSVISAYSRTKLRDDWRAVVQYFLRDIPTEMFRSSTIERHYAEDVNNAQGTCMLVHINDGVARFTERYGKAHSRAASVRYMLDKIAARKRHLFHNLTILVMLSDGHRPRVPTIGSARHWTNWNMMIPAPIGNFRGHFQGWGSPLEKWDEYVEEYVTSTHKDYPWTSKIGKAVFRGALAMQTYTLGSCNEVNGRDCLRARKWDQVNRGVLYRESRKRMDLFDVGFSNLKPKSTNPADQFEGAPKKAPPMDFRDFQKYKFILNVGSNQDWSERLRLLLFMNSAVIYHMAETQEFFSPLLKPWTHYIPTNLTMQDLASNVEWAIRHDPQVRILVRNQNHFAKRYISERSMETYWEVLLEEFAARQAVDS